MCDPTHQPLNVTLAQAATKLGVSKRWVEARVASGELPSVKLSNGARRVRYADLIAFNDRRLARAELTLVPPPSKPRPTGELPRARRLPFPNAGGAVLISASPMPPEDGTRSRPKRRRSR